MPLDVVYTGEPLASSSVPCSRGSHTSMAHSQILAALLLQELSATWLHPWVGGNAHGESWLQGCQRETGPHTTLGCPGPWPPLTLDLSSALGPNCPYPNCSDGGDLQAY